MGSLTKEDFLFEDRTCLKTSVVENLLLYDSVMEKLHLAVQNAIAFDNYSQCVTGGLPSDISNPFDDQITTLMGQDLGPLCDIDIGTSCVCRPGSVIAEAPGEDSSVVVFNVVHGGLVDIRGSLVPLVFGHHPVAKTVNTDRINVIDLLPTPVPLNGPVSAFPSSTDTSGSIPSAGLDCIMPMGATSGVCSLCQQSKECNTFDSLRVFQLQCLHEVHIRCFKEAGVSVCPVCQERVTSLDFQNLQAAWDDEVRRLKQLAKHREKRVNIKALTCSECGQVFNSKGSVWRHRIKVHQKERVLEAPTAKKPADAAVNVLNKRFVCPMCPLKFSREAALNAHVEQQHQREIRSRKRQRKDADGRVCCAECGAEFHCVAWLTRHCKSVHGHDKRLMPEEELSGWDVE